MKNPVRTLRHLGWLEAVSFLLLTGIAMPLKYLAGRPEAVRVIGMAHGVLFVLFCLALAWVWRARNWPAGRCALVLLASLLPFGPFLLDRRMRDWEAESLQRNRAATGI